MELYGLLNKNEQNQRLWQKCALICAFTLLFVGLISAPKSYAQNVCEIKNPAAGADVLPWLACRGDGCSREHLGVDIMLEMCLPVQNQPGCYVVMNGNSAIFDGGVASQTGYGYYTRYRCNDKVEVRYAHLNAYDGNSQMAINGRSGAARPTPPHIHYEVYADAGNGPRAMDPECVWGDSDVATCCQGVSGLCLLGNGPADMCNPIVLTQLSQNHDARAHGGSSNSPPNGYTSKPLTDGVPPASVPPGIHGPPDLPGCDPGSGSGTMDDDGGGDGLPDFPVPDPVVGDILTPSPEPGPPPIGIPGGPADLVPTSTTPSTAKVTGCAVDTWTAMVNQAVLEARRETIMNQRLIAKADSVLTYTCFDQQVRITGQNVGPIFSETSYWANRTVNLMGKTVTISRELGSNSLDASLTLAVDTMARNYITDNFTHGLLGESATVTAPSGTNCNIMDTVWQAAKCKNIDGPFYTFQDLVGVDPRTIPASLNCSP